MIGAELVLPRDLTSSVPEIPYLFLSSWKEKAALLGASLPID